ncbi:hypothetical protein HKX48_001660 [Thoreauomyces humboldtii]|nr:hypothetical protein HKX48_001660 [Thoreauomyces humboldtii]
MLDVKQRIRQSFKDRLKDPGTSLTVAKLLATKNAKRAYAESALTLAALGTLLTEWQFQIEPPLGRNAGLGLNHSISLPTSDPQSEVAVPTVEAQSSQSSGPAATVPAPATSVSIPTEVEETRLDPPIGAPPVSISPEEDVATLISPVSPSSAAAAQHLSSGPADHDITAMRGFFFPASIDAAQENKTKAPLIAEADIDDTPQYGCIGTLSTNTEAGRNHVASTEVYLNTHDPFCLVTLGVQGAGKSHTVANVIECCMLDCPPFMKARPPVKTMVFHFDQDASTCCEAVTMTALQ